MKRSAHIEHHIDIGAPASVIYKLTTDIEQWPSFVTTVTSVHRIDHGPLVVGSKALLNQPHQPVTEWTVRELEPETRFVWSATTYGISITATHQITPTEPGSRNTLTLDLTGFGAGLIGRLQGRKLKQMLETENRCFRREALRLVAPT